MIAAASSLWQNLQSSEVYKQWKYYFIEGAIIKEGLFDNSPYLDYLHDMYASFSTFHRKVTVSALNIETGQIRMFNQDNTEISEFYKAVFSSTCIAG